MKYKQGYPVEKGQTRNAGFSYTTALLLSGIVLATGLLYRSSLNGDFLHYDDTDNVVNNPLIRQLSLANLPRFFSTSTLYMYTPLTFISYAVDFRMSGLDPYYFKLTNLIIHLLSIVLVWLFSWQILRKKTPALLITLLFAVHPMNADSVSWISARSNLLSAFFFLLTLVLYMVYLRKTNYTFLLLSAVSFILSLLSKSSGVMLPFTLLAIDYFQKRKITLQVMLEKFPFLLIGLLMGLITIYFRTDTGNTQTIAEYNLLDRLSMICFSILFYIIRVIVPFHLSEVYAYPMKVNGFLPIWYYAAPFAFIIAGLVIYRLKRLRREIIFGLCFFLINIFLTQMIFLEDGFMANRYVYLPEIGIFFIIVLLFDHYAALSGRVKYYLYGLGVAVLLVFSWSCRQRSMVWKDTLSLFDHVIRQSPGSAFGYNNRGIAKYSSGDPEDALTDYNQAIRLNPRYAGAFYNRGVLYYAIREFEKANLDYTKAIGLNPRFASSYAARGILEMDVLKNDSLAMQDYNRAIAINPAFGMAYYNRGILELRMNDANSACKDFRKVKNLGYSQADEIISQYCP